jgi:hypothetical protein
MKLKNKAPAGFINQNCVAYVSSDQMKENLELACYVASDDSGHSYIEFIKPNPDEIEKLSSWMAEAAI